MTKFLIDQIGDTQRTWYPTKICSSVFYVFMLIIEETRYSESWYFSLLPKFVIIFQMIDFSLRNLTN